MRRVSEIIAMQLVLLIFMGTRAEASNPLLICRQHTPVLKDGEYIELRKINQLERDKYCACAKNGECGLNTKFLPGEYYTINGDNFYYKNESVRLGGNESNLVRTVLLTYMLFSGKKFFIPGLIKNTVSKETVYGLEYYNTMRDDKIWDKKFSKGTENYYHKDFLATNLVAKQYSGVLIRCHGSFLHNLCSMGVIVRPKVRVVTWFERKMLKNWRKLASNATDWLVDANPKWNAVNTVMVNQ